MFRFGLRPGSRFAGGVHCVVQVDEPKPVARCTAGRLKFVERAVYSARFFGRGEVEACRTVIVYGSENVVERHFVDVPSGGEGHFAVVVRIPDFDQQSRAHELVQDIVHDAGGQRKSAAEFVDGERPFVFPKAVYDLEHDGQDDPAASVVADAERFALFGETVDILVGEREFAAEEQDFPRDLQP